eukprot:m.91251 g.91251  ORF g.91251 m.91251 type:complete len:56 (+) comp14625_c2_seq2:433-600(+)
MGRLLRARVGLHLAEMALFSSPFLHTFGISQMTTAVGILSTNGNVVADLKVTSCF